MTDRHKADAELRAAQRMLKTSRDELRLLADGAVHSRDALPVVDGTSGELDTDAATCQSAAAAHLT